ncbi:MAG TPA: pyruvate dehydrogenase complex E1 component subunit beta [Candidatus Margulisiibacteriota bacterium]|nr:pyruvate dehydrogenase complex E1 component subunit beta [Candidatus Margulisiibacteriota bacterium]
MRDIGFIEAINEALTEEMERDPGVFIMGEDVKLGAFGATRGLIDKFGPQRVRNTPISEAGFAGAGIGAAMAGMRPVVEIEFASFFYCCWDQICNQAGKLRYMSGGQARMPITFRCVFGAMGSAAAQHSEVVYPQLLGAPGLKIVVPSEAGDMKGLLKAAIRDDDPVLVFEHGRLGFTRGTVPDGDHVLPLGKGAVKRAGSDVTIVAIGAMVPKALTVADELAKDGIAVEVFDPRSLVPLDEDGLLTSVAKTGRVVIADEGHRRGGAAADLAAIIIDKGFDSLNAPIKRVTALDTPIPFSPPLEEFVLPNEAKIKAAVLAVMA